MSLYYNSSSQTNVTTVFNTLADIPDFWDEKTSDTLTKGDMTVTLTSTTVISISGYGLSASIANTQPSASYCTIGATENGLVCAFGNVATAAWYICLGIDGNSKWGGALGKLASNAITITDLIGHNCTNVSYSYGNTTASDVLTQIVDLISQHGNFIMKDVKRVLITPQQTYRGKMQLNEGDKYVQAGCFALKYIN